MNDSVAGSLDRSFIDSFADRLLAVWNDHDTADLPNLLTDDVAWSDPALAAPTRAVQGVRAFMENSWRAFPDLQFEVTGSRCFADDAPVLVVPWRMTGTNLGPIDPPGWAPTGRRIDVEGLDEYVFRGDRLAVYRAHYDACEVGRQLGLLPATGTRAEHVLVAAQRLRARLRRRRGPS